MENQIETVTNPKLQPKKKIGRIKVKFLNMKKIENNWFRQMQPKSDIEWRMPEDVESKKVVYFNEKRTKMWATVVDVIKYKRTGLHKLILSFNLIDILLS